jgi:hypothetical protein
VDEHELAWAAGFFDGDGWAALVRYGRRDKRRPMARINQGSSTGMPEALVRFRDAVRVGSVAGPKIEEGRKPLYWWVASSRADVVRTGESIGPWLSCQKRGQFEAAVGLTFAYAPASSVAWAAGLFDAEGSTSLSDHRSHAGYKYAEASITQNGGLSTPDELVRFAQIVGLGHVYGPYKQEGASELVFRWRLQRFDEIRRVLHLLQPMLGQVKRQQAFHALRVVDRQPALPRGRVEWGSHKTHCIRGHEYATARVREYVSRGKGVPRRASKQCLVCVRDQARARRLAHRKIGGS